MSSKSTRRRVLLDTSVWVAYFRDPSSAVGDHAEHLMEAREAFVAAAVIYEVLQGTRDPEEFQTLLAKLEEMPCLPMPSPTWVSAAGMAAGLRRRGLTIPMTDILLATLARENGCKIWSLDTHFESIPGVRLYRPPGPRPRRHRSV